jgi:hypothetical protein
LSRWVFFLKSKGVPTPSLTNDGALQVISSEVLGKSWQLMQKMKPSKVDILVALLCSSGFISKLEAVDETMYSDDVDLSLRMPLKENRIITIMKQQYTL